MKNIFQKTISQLISDVSIHLNFGKLILSGSKWETFQTPMDECSLKLKPYWIGIGKYFGHFNCTIYDWLVYNADSTPRKWFSQNQNAIISVAYGWLFAGATEVRYGKLWQCKTKNTAETIAIWRWLFHERHQNRVWNRGKVCPLAYSCWIEIDKKDCLEKVYERRNQ